MTRELVWIRLVASLGFFAIVAQALLFRGYLSSFEGTELGVGAFFASWLVAVALGALAGRAVRSTRLDLISLLYLPAFILQFYLIANIRALAGVAPYEIFPPVMMLGVSMAVNAPVGLMTGALFTVACRGAPSVTRVYLAEALGGFAGGVTVTLLLWAGTLEETIFLVSVLPLSVMAFLLGARIPGAVAGLASILLMVSGLDRSWAEANHRAEWARVLPADSYRGSFSTSQARYFYGEHDGQFIVVSQGGVVETLPDTEHASEIVALHLAQNPNAFNAIVVGTGAIPINSRLSELARIGNDCRVTWVHSDPEYPLEILMRLPENYPRSVEVGRLEPERPYSLALRHTFGLSVINLPDITSLILNGYATQEFFGRCKEMLLENGVLSVRFSGGANYQGDELNLIGSSMLLNLEAVFKNVVLKPGEESWLIASDGEGLSTSPEVLRRRFKWPEIYPPEGVEALYDADRIAYQMDLYRRGIDELGEEVLANTEKTPRGMLFGLAAGLRRSGIPLAPHLPVLIRSLFWIAAAGIAILAFLRLIRPGPAAAPFLVFSTGLAGMALSIVIMFLFQARFGTLYFHVGLISSLFMLGLFFGGYIVERVMEKREEEPTGLVFKCVSMFIAVVLYVMWLPLEAPRVYFALLFLVAGGATGAFFPIAAWRLRKAKREAAGARLEMVDHLGGAVGAALCALVFLPICGTHSTLVLLALLVAVNLIPRSVPRRHAIFGVAAFLLCASQIVARAKTEGRLEPAARELAGGEVETCGDGFAVPCGGYIFGSRDVCGYGGPIELAVHVDAEGNLLGYRVLESSETPAYLKMTEAWGKGLVGRNLFEPGAFEGIDGVSGATMTSSAILQGLERSGRDFAARELGRGAGSDPARSPWIPGLDFICLAVLAVVVILERYAPGRWSRRGLLVIALLLAGVTLNLQYSTQQVFSLLSFKIPLAGLNAAFFSVVLIPLLVVVFGNIYCGGMCPFGALQELVGEFRGRRWDPDKDAWRWGRSVKYLLLILLAALFAFTNDADVLSADPLITFFSPGMTDAWALGLGIGAVALAVVFRRFWCRTLCPAGAFLSLLNGVRLLRRIFPEIRPGRCDMGVRSVSDLDCLGCDRCRHEAK